MIAGRGRETTYSHHCQARTANKPHPLEGLSKKKTQRQWSLEEHERGHCTLELPANRGCCVCPSANMLRSPRAPSPHAYTAQHRARLGADASSLRHAHLWKSLASGPVSPDAPP